jgi:hypothetical protein
MKTRMRVSIVVACVATAGGIVVATQAGASPPGYTTLDQAASKPVGIGVPGVAEGVRGNRADVVPQQVLRNVAAARGGCLVEYGKGGQCLPIVPPSQATRVAAGQMQPRWACAEVRLMFKDGLAVKVAKVDPQGLDANADGIACGRGD